MQLALVAMALLICSTACSDAEPDDDGTPPTETAGLRSDLAIVNFRPRDTTVDVFVPWLTGVGYVRVWGGSRGMATYPTEASVPATLVNGPNPNLFDVVEQAQIDGLIQLQQEHGVRIIYMINVNDTLQSQSDFIDRLMGEGVDLAMLELGNELYLPKFRNGDTSKLGVTRAWTAEQYVELLGQWGPQLRERFPGVPVYGVGASHGPGNSPSEQYRQGWNQTILAGLSDTPTLLDGVVFHHYAGEDSGVPHEEEISNTGFAYLGTFGDLPIAITESGYFFSTVNDANLDLAEEFWSAFRAALKPTDTYGIHTLYNPPGNSDAYALYSVGGRTAVGDRFAGWLSTWADTP